MRQDAPRKPEAAVPPGTVNLTPLQREASQRASQRSTASPACGILPTATEKSHMRGGKEKQHLKLQLCVPKDAGVGAPQPPSLSSV